MSKTATTVLFFFAVGLAACGESAVAPSINQATDNSPNISGGGSNASLSAWDTVRFSFVIDPSRRVSYSLGQGNSITFPAGSLCDPNRSTYGDGEWDKPCVSATRTLTVNAIAWLDGSGNPRIDFNPSIRFVPTSNPVNWVSLSFTDYSASWLASSVIGYCKQVQDKSCADEAKRDPTMATVRDPITGRLTRRIKHFSGYNVFSGRDDDGGDDPSSYSVSSGRPSPLSVRNP